MRNKYLRLENIKPGGLYLKKYTDNELVQDERLQSVCLKYKITNESVLLGKLLKTATSNVKRNKMNNKKYLEAKLNYILNNANKLGISKNMAEYVKGERKRLISGKTLNYNRITPGVQYVLIRENGEDWLISTHCPLVHGKRYEDKYWEYNTIHNFSGQFTRYFYSHGKKYVINNKGFIQHVIGTR